MPRVHRRLTFVVAGLCLRDCDGTRTLNTLYAAPVRFGDAGVCLLVIRSGAGALARRPVNEGGLTAVTDTPDWNAYEAEAAAAAQAATSSDELDEARVSGFARYPSELPPSRRSSPSGAV